MNDINGQYFGETLLAEPMRLTVQWNEGMPFNIEIQRKNKITTHIQTDVFDIAELFQPNQRKPKSYAEFLKQS